MKPHNVLILKGVARALKIERDEWIGIVSHSLGPFRTVVIKSILKTRPRDYAFTVLR